MQVIELKGLTECTGVHSTLGELFECTVCTTLFDNEQEN